MTEPTPADPAPKRRISLPLALGAIAAIAFAIVLAITLFGGDEDDETAAGDPVEVSGDELRDFASERGQPVYWAGEQPGQKLELTVTERDYVYVRYLPDIAPVGDRKPDYTTVASYPVQDAYQAARGQARARGRVTRELPDGGIAVYYRSKPTSVYLAYPNSSTLVEVYDPQPAEARSLALSGRVRPVG